MDTTTFWNLIDETREASNGDPFQQARLLIDKLAKLPEGDIRNYDSILQDLMDQAYIGELWDAAYIVGCGCSDDGFMDFRAWLISRGKEIFEKVLAYAESLVEIVEPGQETQIEELLYVASYAYERRTMRELPPLSREYKQLDKQPLIEPLKLVKFPKLTEKFWNRCNEKD